MEHNIVVIGSNAGKVVSKFGKKSSDSDITMYSQIEGETIINACASSTYPEKIPAMLQLMEFCDFVVFAVGSNIDYSFGELLFMADFFKKPGVFFIEEDFIREQVKQYAKGSFSENYKIIKTDEELKKAVLSNQIKIDEKQIVEVDTFFNVKNVGLVILGFLKSGKVKRYQKTFLYPEKKEILIKSIQVHDKDWEEILAVSRVGFAIKGIEYEELERGQVISNEEFSVKKEFNFEFKKNPFFKEDEKKNARILVGSIIRNAEFRDNKIILDKPIIDYKNEFILFRTDLQKQLRISGTGRIL